MKPESMRPFRRPLAVLALLSAPVAAASELALEAPPELPEMRVEQRYLSRAQDRIYDLQALLAAQKVQVDLLKDKLSVLDDSPDFAEAEKLGVVQAVAASDLTD